MKPYQVERIERACLAAVMLAAMGLRFAGLRWGLPSAAHLFSYHPDEAPLLGPVWYMLNTGDWDPHFYNYGTFYIYLVAVCAKFGALLGLVPLPEGGWTELHLLARSLTALLGVGTVYLVYVIGKDLGGPPVGLGSAALLAVLPAHVVNSHYATVDVLATFLIVLLLAVLPRLFGMADLAIYLVAGLALGLATAAKYTMILGLVPLLFAHLFARDEQGYAPSLLMPIAGLAAAALAFWAVTPFLLLLGDDGLHLNPDFLRDLHFELQHMRIGGTPAFAATGNGWLYHLLRALPAGMGYPALLLGLVGAGLMLRRGPSTSLGTGSGVAMVLLSFALPYFFVIGAGKERFLRYSLPLLPVLVIAGGYALERLRLATPPALAAWKGAVSPAVLGLAVLAGTTWYAGQMVGTMTAADPRTRAAEWLQARAAPRTRIGLASTPWYFTPPLTPFNGGLRSAEEFHRWQREKPPYRVIVTGWDAAALRRARSDFFVVSDTEYADLLRLGQSDPAALMAELPKRYDRLETFEHAPPMPALRPAKLTCPPDWLYTWPRVEVYH
ncbi:MAG TPA: glycosyltransferase family 39 protein [Armatimonadota bacterium]|nr:glycosyltransferase family 39 protein [Armatimonadota bacterium]